MSPSTALIVHPQAPAEPRTHLHPQSNRIEVDGIFPWPTTVHRRPGHYLAKDDIDSGLHRPDCPRREKRSPDAWFPGYDDEFHAARAVRLLDLLTTTDLHGMQVIAEIRSRILILHPYCLHAER